MRPGSILPALALSALLSSCHAGPTPARLNQDNPVRPATAPPFGMEEFFETATPPVPTRARLGRWLFYDTRLSADGTISCASCHRPEHAFSEPTAVSTGIGGRRGRRKAPSLVNLAARTVLVDTPERDRGPLFFWDGRATSLEAQVIAPIAEATEMGLDHRLAVDRLSAITGYRPFFREAFGSEAATLDRVAAALADYVRTRRSGNAPYDRWRYGRDARDRRAVSAEATIGSDIFFFKGRCAMCHAGFNFSDGRFHNLGVGWDAKTETFADEGRAVISRDPRERGAFKTPTLRDVSRHAPYMHDGSLATLRDVVEFYNRGGVANPRRSARLGRLGLTPDEMEALVAFLHTLDGTGYADHPPSSFPQ